MFPTRKLTTLVGAVSERSLGEVELLVETLLLQEVVVLGQAETQDDHGSRGESCGRPGVCGLVSDKVLLDLEEGRLHGVSFLSRDFSLYGVICTRKI